MANSGFNLKVLYDLFLKAKVRGCAALDEGEITPSSVCSADSFPWSEAKCPQ